MTYGFFYALMQIILNSQIATFRLSINKRQSLRFQNATYSLVDMGFYLINNTNTYEERCK